VAKWGPGDGGEPSGRLSVCCSVLKALTKECRTVWQTAPGDRFHSRYRRTRRRKSNGEMGPRVLRIVVAVICVMLGIGFLLLPIPSSPFFLASGALLASESSSLARLLDRIELRLRSWVKAIRKRWRALSPPWKGVVASFLLAVLVVKIYFIYRIYHYCRG
jgi:uncharacterized membrane protein YbaN (DUF454 family)